MVRQSVSAARRLGEAVSARVAPLLGIPAGSREAGFWASVGYLVGTDVFLTLITFGATAGLIRLLGPVDFGHANVIVGVAQFLLVPLLLGLHAAAARHVAATPREAAAIVGSALLTFGIVVGVAVPVLLLLTPQAQQVFGVTRPIYAWSVAYAAVLAVHLLAAGVVGGLHRFRALAGFNMVAGIAYAVVAFGVLVFASSIDYADYVMLNAGRWLVIAGLVACAVRGVIGRPSRRWAGRLLHFGAYHSAGALAHFFILGSIDTIMLNAYQGPAAAGIYGAYYIAFNVVTAKLLRHVSDVLMPTAARAGVPLAIRGRIVRYLRLAGWVVVPGVTLVTAGLFWLYGESYPFDWRIGALVGVSVYLYAAASMLNDAVVAHGLTALRWSVALALLVGVVNVGGNAVLIPRFGVGGCVAATVVATLLTIALRYRLLGHLASTVTSGTPQDLDA